jgi:hypothetical protein
LKEKITPKYALIKIPTTNEAAKENKNTCTKLTNKK